jgi:hypothetical protein
MILNKSRVGWEYGNVSYVLFRDIVINQSFGKK